MNFFTNRIVTKPISLEEAVKKGKSTPKVRSLDEILSSSKTASAEAQVKTASAQASAAPSAEVAAPAPAPAAPAPAPEIKAAAAPEAKVVEAAKVEVKDEIEVVEVEQKPAVVAKPSNVTLKVAKKLDFRGWSAEDVVKAWGQHGDMQKCMANVAGSVSDAKTYCGLLQVASAEAMKVVKASAAKQEKKASSSAWVKISKLADKDRAMLAKYYTRIYGKDYVDALLEDY